MPDGFRWDPGLGEYVTYPPDATSPLDTNEIREAVRFQFSEADALRPIPRQPDLDEPWETPLQHVEDPRPARPRARRAQRVRRDTALHEDAIRRDAMFSITPLAPGETLALRTCSDCGNTFRMDRDMFARTQSGQYSRSCRRCVRLRREAAYRVRQHGRKFGVEIEFTYAQRYESRYSDSGYSTYEARECDDLVSALIDAGINVENAGYTHAVYDGVWKIVTDASVEYGYEIVSPPLTWDQRDQVHTVCRVIREMGGDVDESCGLHVHHDVQDLSLRAFKRLVTIWDDNQSLTNALIDPERARYSEWSRPFRRNEVRQVCNIAAFHQLRNETIYIDRYRALNVSCFAQYGTVEVRQHEGTLDSDKILAWVAYGQALIKSAKSTRRPTADSIHELLDALPFESDAPRQVLKLAARVPLNVTNTDDDVYEY